MLHQARAHLTSAGIVVGGHNGAVAADRPLLDLDSDPDVDAPPDPLRLREIRVPLWVVALVAIGCVVIAVGFTRAWDENRARRERRAVVSLLLSVPADGGLSG